jgi:hypothetical protein
MSEQAGKHDSAPAGANAPVKTVAPVSAPAPLESVGKRRQTELRAAMRKAWWRTSVVAGPLAIGGVAVVVLSIRNPAEKFGLGAAIGVVAAVIGTYWLADSRAKAAFLPAWAVSRGWAKGIGALQGGTTPLLRDGDRRNSKDHVNGPLSGGGNAMLCHYTYETRSTTTDARGNTTTTYTPHDFTVVCTDAAPPGIPRLTLHPRSALGAIHILDKVDSAVTSNRTIELESSELDDKFKLEVADETSDEAVRLLFEPSFIVWCVEQADGKMMVETENGTLLVAIPHHSYDAAQLDGLVQQASTVATRIAETNAVTTR